MGRFSGEPVQGRVIAPADTPRSYLVHLPSGEVHRIVIRSSQREPNNHDQISNRNANPPSRETGLRQRCGTILSRFLMWIAGWRFLTSSGCDKFTALFTTAQASSISPQPRFSSPRHVTAALTPSSNNTVLQPSDTGVAPSNPPQPVLMLVVPGSQMYLLFCKFPPLEPRSHLHQPPKLNLVELLFQSPFHCRPLNPTPVEPQPRSQSSSP